MAQLICPSCNTPSEDGYCSNCLIQIPIPESDDQEEPSVDSNLPMDSDCQDEQGWTQQRDGSSAGSCDHNNLPGSDEPQQVICSFCGMPGLSGRECPQCGAMLPMVNNDALQEHPTHAPICLTLPGGQKVELTDGRNYSIGRDGHTSEIFISEEGGLTPLIKQVLSNAQYVSKRHCTISVNYAANTITVRDEGSTNGTFIGMDRRAVRNQETSPLPTTLWLGSYVTLSIDS